MTADQLCSTRSEVENRLVKQKRKKKKLSSLDLGKGKYANIKLYSSAKNVIYRTMLTFGQFILPPDLPFSL